MNNEVCIVCDWKDANPFPTFIEAEVAGRSVKFDWRDRADGLKELVIPATPPAGARDAVDAVARILAESIGHGMREKCEPLAQEIVSALTGKADGGDESCLPVQIHGTIYNVPIGVQLHIVQLRDKLNAIGNTRRNHPVIELLYATEHCLSAAEEGVDYSVSRPMLDAMTTLGLMEKVGRGKWAPTDAAAEFVKLANSYATQPAATGMGDAIAEPPRTELRRLVTRWRALAATWADIFPDRKYRMETCANELEAALAAQPAPGVGLTAIEAEALEGLIMVAYHAWSLADNAEETDAGHNVDATDFQQLSDSLDRLDALPDDQPGYTMSEAAKARWALRRLTATRPAESVSQGAPAISRDYAMEHAEYLALDAERLIDSINEADRLRDECDQSVESIDEVEAAYASRGDCITSLQSAIYEFRKRRDRQVAQGGEVVELDCYDAGLLNDFGGGNVEWWQDYIRAELARAHDFYQSQLTTPTPATGSGGEAEGLLNVIDLIRTGKDGRKYDYAISRADTMVHVAPLFDHPAQAGGDAGDA